MILQRAAHSLGRTWAILLIALSGAPVHADLLQYGDGRPNGSQTLPGEGHLTLFDARGDGRWLNKVEVFGSRQGADDARGESFHLYVIDLDGRALRKVSLPYSLWERGDAYWCELPLPPTQVPREFGLGLTFGRTETQGVNVGTDTVPESHSYVWVPGSEGRGLGSRDWMIRAHVDDTPGGDPDARDLVVLAGGRAFFDRVISVGGRPPVVTTADHNPRPLDEVATIRLGAATSPSTAPSALTLANGVTIPGELVSLDAEAVLFRDEEGTEHRFPRAQVARLDFGGVPARRIAAQPEPRREATDGKPSWCAMQATGPPDTPRAGDRPTAWATRQPDAGPEWLRVDYDTAVDIGEVRIRESYNPGAVVKVAAVLDEDTEVVLWEGEDPTTDAPDDLVIAVADPVEAKSIKVYLDTTRKPGWNEIDAVELVGKDGTRQWASGASASSSYADRRRRGGGELLPELR